jgi:hypothetical protein
VTGFLRIPGPAAAPVHARGGRFASLAALLLVGCCAVACGDARSRAAHASDSWRRSYPLTGPAEVQIVGAVGSIDVRTGESGAVLVEAERTVRAQNEAIAASMVERVRITEDVTPGRVMLRNDGLGGVVVAADVEVNFRVTVPPETRVRLRTAVGAVTVTGLTGAVVASTDDGSISAVGLRGPVEARAVNGPVTVALAAVGAGPVVLHSTSGTVSAQLPADAAAELRASTTNGTVSVEGFTITATGTASATRLEGRLGAGGPHIDLSSTNGNVLVRPVP